MAMNSWVITLILLLLFPQAAPLPAPPTPKRASAEVQARILKLQLKEAQIQSAFQACNAQDFQGQYTQTSLAIQQQVNEAFKEAGLDKKDWDLDTNDTFAFIKKQVAPPPAASPAPEPKKP